MVFVGEVSVYEQETQVMALVFITMIVACITATNRWRLVFMVWHLTK